MALKPIKCLPISVLHCHTHWLTQPHSSLKMNTITSLKFHMMTIIFIVLNLDLIRTRTLQISKYQSIIAPTNRNFLECTGSLIIETARGEEKRFAVSKQRTHIRAKNVRVEGCGCFRVYKRPGFKASSRFISSLMDKVSGDHIGFKIRSIEKVSCDEQ